MENKTLTSCINASCLTGTWFWLVLQPHLDFTQAKCFCLTGAKPRRVQAGSEHDRCQISSLISFHMLDIYLNKKEACWTYKLCMDSVYEFLTWEKTPGWRRIVFLLQSLWVTTPPGRTTAPDASVWETPPETGRIQKNKTSSERKKGEKSNPCTPPMSFFTQRVRRSSASGSSVANFRFSKLILSLGLWFQANSTASWKVVTSRSYWPTSFLNVIWRNEGHYI